MATPKITPGNKKLGTDIWAWSLPAKVTCPGRTAACMSACYATRGHFVFGEVKRLYEANLTMAKSRVFVEFMIGQLRQHRPSVLRIHVSGDFFSVRYIRDWCEIAERCPRTQMFAFTRSWRKPKLREALRLFGARPNVRLWWSQDQDAHEAVPTETIRAAYMARSDEDAEAAPQHTDLVFRTTRKTVLKKTRTHGTQVCPVENGISTDINCGRCGICWDVQSPLYRLAK